MSKGPLDQRREVIGQIATSGGTVQAKFIDFARRLVDVSTKIFEVAVVNKLERVDRNQANDCPMVLPRSNGLCYNGLCYNAKQ